MVRVTINSLGISEVKWMGKDEFNSDDHYIYNCGKESLRRNGVGLAINKTVQNSVLGCNLKNDRMILIRFQGKPLNVIVILVYAPATKAEEVEVEWFYEALYGLLEITTKKKKKRKRCPLHHRGLEGKSRKSRDTWSNRKVWPWNEK